LQANLTQMHCLKPLGVLLQKLVEQLVIVFAVGNENAEGGGNVKYKYNEPHEILIS